ATRGFADPGGMGGGGFVDPARSRRTAARAATGHAVPAPRAQPVLPALAAGGPRLLHRERLWLAPGPAVGAALLRRKRHPGRGDLAGADSVPRDAPRRRVHLGQ